MALGSSDARVPSVEVVLNGASVPGIIDAEIFACSHFAQGRFRVRAALSATGAAFWSAADQQVSIAFSLDGGGAVGMTGQVDRIEIDPIRGEVLADGRDLSARLLTARTQETFENRTASEIATDLAGRHGLTASVTATTQRVGRDFQNGYARTTLDQYSRATTEWDLLTRLAEAEGFDVWVDDTTLHFESVVDSGDPYVIAPTDCIGMRLESTLGLQNGLKVVVKSWDCRGQAVVTQSSMAQSGGDTAGARYVIVRPNLVAEAAQSLADRVLDQMSRHVRTVHLDMPGELTLQPRMTLSLTDTETDFDGPYVVASVERRLSYRHGFTQTIEARTPSWTGS